jgi:hypothetical protein
VSLDTTLDAVEVTAVEDAKVAKFQAEAPHFDLAFNLFRECTAYVCILSSTTVGKKQSWSVGQAVLGGHLVRSYKLMCFVLEEAIKDRAELFSILTRLLAEGAINLRFLIRKFSDELVDSFLSYSLQHEKDLAELIRRNIEERGSELPIEKRMLSSIAKSFRNSLKTEASLPEKKIRNWGEKNLFEKAKAVDLAHAYSAVFGGPSRNVHGGWQDMIQHHLKCVSPGEFEPRVEFTRARPQAVYALCSLVTETLSEYVKFLSHEALAPLALRLEDLQLRNGRASELHEKYLVRRAG